MPRLLRTLRLTLALGLAIGALPAAAADEPMIILFYEDGCPDCEVIDLLIEELAIDLPAAAFARYELSDRDSFDLFLTLASAFEIEASQVPTVFVGDEVVVGAGRAEEFALRAAIGTCTVRGCPSPLDRIRPPQFPWGDVLRLIAMAGGLAILVILQPL